MPPSQSAPHANNTQLEMFPESATSAKKSKDSVNSPDHYNQGTIECKDYIREVLGDEGFVHYCHGNLIKYQHRWRDKGEPLKDLAKAHVYLGWMKEVQEEIDRFNKLKKSLECLPKNTSNSKLGY